MVTFWLPRRAAVLVGVLAALVPTALVPAAAVAQSLLTDTLPGRPITLEALVRIGVRRALPVLGARLDVDASAAAVRGTEALFDPSLTLSPDVSWGTSRLFLPTGITPQWTSGNTLAGQLAGVLPTSTQYGVSINSAQTVAPTTTTRLNRLQSTNILALSVGQPFLRGAGAAGGRAQREAAEIGLEAAELRFQRQAEQLVANLEIQYWAAAQREEQERVARQSLERAQTLHARNLQLRRLQRITAVDSVTSEAGVASRLGALATAVRVRQDALDALILLAYGADAPAELARDVPALRTVTPPPEPPPLPGLADAERLAVQGRPDREAAQRDLDRQGRLLRVARNGLLPQVNVVTTYVLSGVNVAGRGFAPARTADVGARGLTGGVAVSVPLRNNGARAALELTRASYEQARLGIVEAENSARGDTRQAYRGITLGREALDQAVRALALTRRQFEMESERLRLGLSDVFRLLQVEDAVSNAQLTEVAARYALAGAVTQFQLARGNVLLARYGFDPRVLRVGRTP